MWTPKIRNLKTTCPGSVLLPMFSILLALLVTDGSAATQHPSILLQEAVYAEEIDGDLDKAMILYKMILEDNSARQYYVSQAAFRLGTCYLKKDDKAQAARLFR